MNKKKKKKSEEGEEKKVTVFTAPNCPYCGQLKDFLKENDVDFKEIDLSKNPEKGQKLVEKTSQMGVPVTFIKQNEEEKNVVGFDQDQLKKILDI